MDIISFLKNHEIQRVHLLARSYLSSAKTLLAMNPTLSVSLAEYGYRFAKARRLRLDDFEDQLVASFYNDSNFCLATGQDGWGNLNFPAANEIQWRRAVSEGSKLILENGRGKQVQIDDLRTQTDYLGDLLKYTFSPKGNFVYTYLEFRYNGYDITYIDSSNKEIATFGFVEPDRSEWKSDSGRYHTTRNGIFNSRDERVVEFDISRALRHWSEIEAVGFSSDCKFFFLIDRLFLLDAETILARLNESALFGEIASFDENEQKQYMIH